MLAEEIQHGLDRVKNEAGNALRRGLTNEQFHREVFERIIKNYESGVLNFLTEADIAGIWEIVGVLQ